MKRRNLEKSCLFIFFVLFTDATVLQEKASTPEKRSQSGRFTHCNAVSYYSKEGAVR